MSKHFEDALSPDIPVIFIEGQHRETRDAEELIEIRMDGPDYTEFSKGVYEARIEVNTLISSAMDDTNYHRFHQNCGVVAAAYTTIKIFRYGVLDAEDDGTILGCMKLLQGDRESIQTNNFGQIDVKTHLLQGTIEGHYVMELRA